MLELRDVLPVRPRALVVLEAGGPGARFGLRRERRTLPGRPKSSAPGRLDGQGRGILAECKPAKNIQHYKFAENFSRFLKD